LSMAAEKRHFTCVICPIGCEIDVEVKDGEIVSMEGNKCTKSEEFVRQELVEPMRTLTTTVRIKGARWPMLPVRTDRPIPKRLFFDVMKEVAGVEVQAPAKVSDVVVKDVAGSGADIVASRNMEAAGSPE
jgi:CxxC motif-containing protein